MVKLATRETWEGKLPSARCEVELARQLETVAAELGVSKATLIRTAVEKFLQENPNLIRKSRKETK